MKLSLVYVCYHSYSSLLNSIDSLANSLLWERTDLSFEIVIVDNSFFDSLSLSEYQSLSSILALRSSHLFRQLLYIAAPKNIGFSAASNIGISRSSSSCIILCNCDVAYPVSFVSDLRHVVETLLSNSNILVAGPMLLGDSSPYPSMYTYTSSALFLAFKPLLRLSAVTNLTLPSYIQKWLSKCWSSSCQKSGNIQRDMFLYTNWVSGAFMLLSPSFFRFFKGLDERFFLYYEDVDIGLSVNSVSKHVAFFPSLRVYHPGGYASSNQKGLRYSLVSNRAFIYHLQSWFLFVFKWRRQILGLLFAKLIRRIAS